MVEITDGQKQIILDALAVAISYLTDHERAELATPEEMETVQYYLSGQ